TGEDIGPYVPHYLFRLNLPRAVGGLELDPATTVALVEELSRADGSAGWTVLIGNSTAFFAWLQPRVLPRSWAATMLTSRRPACGRRWAGPRRTAAGQWWCRAAGCSTAAVHMRSWCRLASS